ncbi:xanthine dehydrogenase family protein molybdopterin-binding subunit [Roseomonas frigidaquae]|uniref:Xanthine dehydrogenase family protein molybdopterin-binding subunit n=1 Tax=Falsiroseomonas frigidaquae TaxID=487318 RepID=A0ABX1F4E8_9PROT|nr:molybdopterin cofactor-binding domain-containing protein [Falsiroseomonas frigidaquae]NKE47237.1 xanthine dehydrogenase family protein molybdopterin-binding subunit [Falsiroseomonas frigidaquae]
MNAIRNPSRRRILGTAVAAAGAFTLGFRIPMPGEAAAQGTPAAAPASPEVNAWVVVKPDDTVVIRIARSEMGQGTLTGLAQLVAEELECDWAKVTTEYPTPGQNLARGRIWGNMSTGGSRGIRDSHDYVRKGGAAARMMLVQAAANAWSVPAGECRAAASVITHAPTGRTTTYGQVAEAAGRLPVPTDVAVKNPADWKIAGQPVPRLDTRAKLNGSQVYGMDLKLPGMLNAAIHACPVFGGKVREVDSAEAERMPGVKRVLRVGDYAVAVVADTWWRAKTALDAVKITWDEGEHANASSASFEAVMREGLEAPQAALGNRAGDAAAGLAGATKRIEAVYGYPHQNHACMEVMNATAVWTPERCEVWTPTQNGEAAHAAAAEAAGLPPAQTEIHKIHLGGGFGRRGAVHDWVRQVVDIAKQMPGTPVKLLWTREEDMLQGRFHPVTMCKLVGGLDAEGKLTGLTMRISGQSIVAGIFPQNIRDGRDPVVFQGLNASGGEADIGYTIPNLLIDHAMRNPHVPPGFWRGVNLNQNAIYLECFMDELAHAAGKDPLEFRRALMANHPKHLAVLNAVAERAGWGTPAAPVNGQAVHRGLCVTHGFGSYVAACAEVSVSDAGDLKVHRIVAATDPGHAVNPQQIAAQVEGSFVYGLSAALYGACTVKDGRIEQTNFDTYPVMRMADMPKVESIILPSGGFWGGVGEPTIAVAAPAVLNAVFAATGKRVRSLPLQQADLRRT